MNMAYAMGSQAAEQGGSSQLLGLLPLFILLGLIVLAYQVGKRRGRNEALNTVLTCHNCKASYAKGEKFCRKCGDPLA